MEDLRRTFPSLGSRKKILNPRSCTQNFHSLDLHQNQNNKILDSPCVPHPWIKSILNPSLFWLDPRAYKEHCRSQLLSVASSLLITCLPSRQVRKFLCLTRGKGMVSSTADLRVGLCNIVCVKGSWMVRLVVVGFVHCYSVGVGATLDNHTT